MILYIAEKPSLGRAIADVLPKPLKKGDGFIRAANGDCVSWCVGHLLEQAEPDAYSPEYKSWKFEHLPIVPDTWKMKPKYKMRSQIAVLRGLVKEASQLVNAGDPDREGQLLVDEIIAHLGVRGAKLQNAQRLLISDLNPQAVKRALGQLRSNREFIPLSTSALARSRADWLYGMNMTRAYTIQGRKVGYQGVLSVGRVQTPVLGLVVRRDAEIADFISKPFYEVLAHLATDSQDQFSAKWQPSDACRPYMDEEGRVLSKGLAQNVVGRINGQNGTVEKVLAQDKKQNAPLPYSLSSLQIDAAKRFGMSAKSVLDTCQSLYEKHKLITYPRSDSRYLPVEQHSLAPSVIRAVLSGASELVTGCEEPNAKLKSKAWNDKKVDAHHAIVPTEKTANLTSLSPVEKQLYLQISRQYLMQFYPAYLYKETQVEVIIAGGQFKTKAKQEVALGWKQLLKQSKSAGNDKNSDSKNDDDEHLANIPALKKGQVLLCERGELLEKQTQAPKHFTDATLLGAMTGINRYVTNPEIRKILKDTDGLGTEATRAGIIELLFKRNYLTRQGKSILATEVGKGLVNSLPQSATTPDMTALWENNLDAISRKEAKYQNFMDPLVTSIHELITQAGSQLPTSLQGVKSPETGFKKRRYASKKPGTTSSSTKAKRAPVKRSSAAKKN
ncbi:DNA topoisomerase III [Shewanella marinintestina]|uniref:DNA topoisomerase III n=1 Tax=Shewanella marinintestina TaxID=190305 RepID=UPI00200C25E9|nr:DNA topoisomerase III [Shewanella marinintestina]MCL1147684.1 DNA topoisomerase III [Shewanella marinintestina]